MTFQTPRDVLERAYRALVRVADAHGQSFADALANVEESYREELRAYIAEEYGYDL